MTKDGTIAIQGKNITGKASGPMILKGATDPDKLNRRHDSQCE